MKRLNIYRTDELLEVTPLSYRIRSIILPTEERGRLTKKAKERLGGVICIS